MHIVFDLQAVLTPLADNRTTNSGDYALFLARAVAQHADAQGHRITLLLPATDVEVVVRVRRQFADLLHGDVELQVWHSMSVVTPWHRQAQAVMYQQLLGRLAADALVFSDISEAGGHPLAGGMPAWLPAGCRGVFLLGRGSTVRDLPGDLSQWSQAVDSQRVAVCAPETTEKLAGGADPFEVQLLPSFGKSQDSAYEAQAAQALFDLLRRLRVTSLTSATSKASQRPRLAYVSPLPPARTGIADYGVDLVAALSAHYAIDLIVERFTVDANSTRLPADCNFRSVEWFMQHGDEFDRVLYHFGNSPFHHHMAALCEKFPGTVVLHDFFLGDLLWTRDSEDHPGRLQQAYYRSHGYGALRDALQSEKVRSVLARYPVNFEFLRHSRGVIVHSERACELAMQWLPNTLAKRFRHIPLLRIPATSDDRAARRQSARLSLGIAPGRFVVCCFGMVGRAKANLVTLQAWLSMNASTGGDTELVFVGGNEESEYGRLLLDVIANAGDAGRRVKITGWIDAEGYRSYLDATDVAVQLRIIDRGETSAAVLDCMNHAVPTIVNNSGSMAELPSDTVYKVPAECTMDDIAAALIHLHRDAEGRAAISIAAAALIHLQHSPATCATAYRNALEDDFYLHAAGTWQSTVHQLLGLPDTAGQDRETLAALSNAVAANVPPLLAERQLFVDVTAICRNDLKTGIQRVVRALLVELIDSPPPGYRIEPVYLCDRTGVWHLRYARKYTLDLLDMHPQGTAFEDEVVESQSGDRFLGLDFSSSYIVEVARLNLFDALRRNGVGIHFVVYDLLPVLRPEVFPQEAGAIHERWLHAILQLSDSVVCISHAVAGELSSWRNANLPNNSTAIEAFHLGADVAASAPTKGFPHDAERVLSALVNRPTFLAVGTVEPRKGIAQALAAFELLWRKGIDVNLVLVGKPGWHVDTLIEVLQSHPEIEKRLFWLIGISDEYLEVIYSKATCLLAASEAEGFGLPLIEAAQKGLPIIARNIPVFKEIAEDHAFFFAGSTAWSLAEAVTEWLELHEEGKAPDSKGVKWLTWKKSTQALVEKIFRN